MTRPAERPGTVAPEDVRSSGSRNALAKLGLAGCVILALLAGSGCGKSDKHVVRGGDVVREFKAHGIFLQNNKLFDDQDAITGAYFAVSPEVAKVRLVVFVCRREAVARQIALRRGSPLPRAAAAKRWKNVVLYLAPELDPQTRREAIEALTSL